MSARDTIYALSSGHLPAAIAVVRISGPRAGDALKALAGRLPEPRRAMLARLRDPQSGELIDEALALWFPGPKSETGEDTAELQLHGGRAVVAATFASLAQLEGLRPAGAGEFTRRAFENGQLDLTRVEGLADLIYADSEAQRRQALRQMRGLLGDRAEAWRQRLIDVLALVEAQIDFPDEGDVPTDLVPRALAQAGALRDEIAAALDDSRRGERLRDGLVVAIAGPPNAGKSSLLNRLVRREAAIVSPYAGTTRDVIEVHLDLEGYPVVLLDTAGIRDSDDPVEQEGVRRARARAAESDLVLWIVDAEEMSQAELRSKNWLKSALDSATRDAIRKRATTVWLVINKTDLHPLIKTNNLDIKTLNIENLSRISARNGEGLPDLLAGLAQYAKEFFATTENALVTRERHRALLQETVAALDHARSHRGAGRDEELFAEDVRLAARALGRLTGRVDVDDILDVIFTDFCIGK
jgi:tRNA modification GTPase